MKNLKQDNMVKSCYIHIPFCSHICSYCDFAKMYYNEELVDKYLVELEKELKRDYQNFPLETIYIGGGTPSALNMNQLTKLFSIIKILKLSNNYEFTFECNVENTTKEKLELLYKNGVNRLSFGVQTFNDKYLNYLNRNHTKEDVFKVLNLAKEIGFTNMNVDLMYGFKNQTIDELKEDLKTFLILPITHISTYSLIIEEQTKLYINNEKNIDEDLEYEMYKYICNYLERKGFNHYEISNFSLDSYYSRHNTTYWHNENYYGFGVGASGYIDNVRYSNTRSINNYLKGNYRLEEHKLSKLETMENEMILGLRMIDGVSLTNFFKKYNCHVLDVFDINKLLTEKFIVIKDDYLSITKDNLYISNSILEAFIH